MAQATPAQPTTVTPPKVHPLLIGGTYGLVAAVLNTVTLLVNQKAVSNNVFVSILGNFLIPFVGLILAGHYAGRHQRLTNLKTNIASGARAIWAGTGAGLTSGVVYVLLGALATSYLDTKLGIKTGTSNGVVQFFASVGGLIIWFFLGLFGGTIGGILGDNQAHNQLKKG